MALLLEFQTPILVALWARFVQREAVRPRVWVGLVLAMAGLAAATGIWHGLVLDPVGIAAAVAAAVFLATYFLIGEHGVGTLDPLRVVLWSFLVAAVALNLIPRSPGSTPLCSTSRRPCWGRWRSTTHRCGPP
jgi:drug/metabolite transporter (DMT)-like permease